MTIKQIKYFQEICKQKSISKASKVLYISQPALTTSLKKLEEDLGSNLFKRLKGSMVLTREGSFFLEKSKDLIKLYDKTIAETKDFANKRKLLKIGIPLQAGVLALPTIFKEFQKEFPGIKIELLEIGGIDIFQKLLDEEIQVAITSTFNHDNSNFNIEPLFKGKVCLCVSSKSKLASLTSITFEDALKEDLVCLDESYFITEYITKKTKELNLDNNILFTSNQLGTIKTMVRNNIASTFLLDIAITKDDNIVAIPLEKEISSTICIITKKNIHLYKEVKKIRNLFVEKFKSL